MRRIKTDYVGVYFREKTRQRGNGLNSHLKEKIFYAIFKKAGVTYEEKVASSLEGMTASKASLYRAERLEGKILSKKEKRDLEANRWTIGKLWQEYQRTYPDQKSMSKSIYIYGKYIGPAFANKEPANIIPFEVDRMRLRLLKRVSAVRVRDILKLLTRLSNFGHKKQLCPGLSFTPEIPKGDGEKTEDLTPEQLSNLLTAIREDPHEQAGPMMLMVLYTGMRKGELLRLKWKDIDFHHNIITLREPKSGQDETIPLNADARKLLENSRRTSEFVFPNPRGKQRVCWPRAVNDLKKKAGLPDDFRPLHGLRHVFASMLASSGKVTMYELQKLLTHKSPVMTQRYAHLRDEALARASSVAGDLIRETMNGK